MRRGVRVRGARVVRPGFPRQVALLRSDVLGVETVTVQPRSAELDRQRLARLFDDHAAGIRGLVGARCGDWALADDITARTFLDAAEQFAKGRAGDVTRRWLHVVALRRLTDHWRRGGRSRGLVERLSHYGRPADSDLAVDEPVVTAALDSLPMRQRAVLCLRYLDDWSTAEIAEALELSIPAVESLLARARRSFSAQIGEDPR